MPDPGLNASEHLLAAARLAAIVDSSDDAIVSKTLDGIILSWNRAAERVFGYSAEEMIGNPIYRLIPTQLHEEEANTLARIARGEHVSHYETMRLRKDGRLIPIDLTISAVRNPQGEIVGAASIKRDVSERKRTSTAMARTAAIIESSEDAIVSKNLDGQVVSWNPAAERIFGYTASEMVGRSIFQLIPEDWRQEEVDILSRIARGEHVAHYETVRRRKDGKEINISLTISPVRDENGNVIGAASIKRDITAQKLIEIGMRQSAKMESIGRLAGGLAHDFNNQLHALSGFLHFVLREPGLSATAHQDLMQVQKAADRMASITSQLLAFARQQVLTPETLDLDMTVADTQPLLQRLIGSNVEIHLESSPGPKWVLVDRAQLVQVLLNLSINARDAMPRGGRLTIRTGTLEIGPHQQQDRTGTVIEPGAYAQLLVRDTGEGIDPDQLARIFEPFYTTKEVGLGTGLGLATVEGVVSQSGGYLQVTSTPGLGTAITILFPLRPAPSREETPDHAVHQAEWREGRILLVDDDQQVRAVIARLLRSEGHDVVEAGHGQEALECMEQGGGGIDLVITDLVMPVMGGREFVEELKRRYPGVDTIWISGYPRENEFLDSDPGIDQPFLQKPISPSLLIDTVQETLRRRRAPKAPGQRHLHS